jgi:PEGA domain
VNIKNAVGIIFSVLFLIAVGVFVYIKVLPQISIFSSSALNIASGQTVAQVYLNGRLIGTTPLKKTGISFKKGLLRVTSSQNVWEQNVTFTPNAETTLNLDLGVSPSFSGSDVVWLDRSNSTPSLSIVSDPSDSQVSIDGTDVGTTPLSLNITAGTHLVKISKDNYLPRSLNILARDSYKINVSSHLFLLPLPKMAELASNNPAVKIYEVSGDSPLLSSDFHSWAEAVSYWQSVTEASPSATFNYMLDSNGGLYDRGGAELKSFPSTVPPKLFVAYLSKPGETALSTEAGVTFTKLLSGGQNVLVKILPTGQAWLRVRDAPNGTEIGRATVGSTYPEVAVNGDWTQITLENGQKGWVSSAYVEIVPPAASTTPGTK